MVVAGFNHVYFCCEVLSLTWESMWIDSLLEPAPRGHLRNCSFWNLQKKPSWNCCTGETQYRISRKWHENCHSNIFIFAYIFPVFCRVCKDLLLILYPLCFTWKKKKKLTNMLFQTYNYSKANAVKAIRHFAFHR